MIIAAQNGPIALRLNITADEPVSSSPMKFGNMSSTYNYTALLTGSFVVRNITVDLYDLNALGALNQAKTDMEQLFDNRPSHSSVHWHQNTVHNDPNRLLFVLLGIVLVGLIFGATVLFFQRMYVSLIDLIHNYSPFILFQSSS